VIHVTDAAPVVYSRDAGEPTLQTRRTDSRDAPLHAHIYLASGWPFQRLFQTVALAFHSP
jgi:hypothetical protein